MSSYEALRSGVAWFDISARGKLRLEGEDCARLLHAMSTNDVQHLETWAGCHAFFLSAQGRILAEALVYRLADSFWLDTEPAVGAALAAHLDKYIIADDVTITDETERFAAFALEGPCFADAAAQLGLPLPGSRYGCSPWEGGFVARSAVTGQDGLRLIIPGAARDRVVTLLSQLPEASEGDVETVRVENGQPLYGVDISERYLVQETGVADAVHFQKGCYLGQEIVERVRSRGQVHRHLSRLRIGAEVAPERGTKILLDGKEVGEITSAMQLPASSEVAALGYLRTEATVGNPLLTVEDAPARRI